MLNSMRSSAIVITFRISRVKAATQPVSLVFDTSRMRSSVGNRVLENTFSATAAVVTVIDDSLSAGMRDKRPVTVAGSKQQKLRSRLSTSIARTFMREPRGMQLRTCTSEYGTLVAGMLTGPVALLFDEPHGVLTSSALQDKTQGRRLIDFIHVGP